jgi:hypothetical protein
LAYQVGALSANKSLRASFLCPSQGHTTQAQVPLDPEEREALFREFADYQRTHEPQKAAVDLDPKQRETLFRDFARYQKQRQTIIAYHGTATDQ